MKVYKKLFTFVKKNKMQKNMFLKYINKYLLYAKQPLF